MSSGSYGLTVTQDVHFTRLNITLQCRCAEAIEISALDGGEVALEAPLCMLLLYLLPHLSHLCHLPQGACH
jgi:hypothetical protein